MTPTSSYWISGAAMDALCLGRSDCWEEFDAAISRSVMIPLSVSMSICCWEVFKDSLLATPSVVYGSMFRTHGNCKKTFIELKLQKDIHWIFTFPLKRERECKRERLTYSILRMICLWNRTLPETRLCYRWTREEHIQRGLNKQTWEVRRECKWLYLLNPCTPGLHHISLHSCCNNLPWLKQIIILTCYFWVHTMFLSSINCDGFKFTINYLQWD